jgi:hypothetical protein
LLCRWQGERAGAGSRVSPRHDRPVAAKMMPKGQTVVIAKPSDADRVAASERSVARLVQLECRVLTVLMPRSRFRPSCGATQRGFETVCRRNPTCASTATITTITMLKRPDPGLERNAEHESDPASAALLDASIPTRNRRRSSVGNPARSCIFRFDVASVVPQTTVCSGFSKRRRADLGGGR